MFHVMGTLYYTRYMHIYLALKDVLTEINFGWSKKKKRIGLCIDRRAHADPRRKYIKNSCN